LQIRGETERTTMELVDLILFFFAKAL